MGTHMGATDSGTEKLLSTMGAPAAAYLAGAIRSHAHRSFDEPWLATHARSLAEHAETFVPLRMDHSHVARSIRSIKTGSLEN